MHILIVEDDRDYRNLLFDYLSPKHDVSVVENGLKAVALLSTPEISFDLVIIDIRMPVMDGSEILNSFAQWSGCKACFLVISGEMELSSFEEIPSVIGCLNKPFSLQQLDPIISRIEHAKKIIGGELSATA